MVHMINPINVIHCIIDCVCLVHIIIKFSAIFDLNNDEKKEPNISRASWLATIKVHFFRKFYYCSQKYSISLFFLRHAECWGHFQWIHSHFQWQQYVKMCIFPCIYIPRSNTILSILYGPYCMRPTACCIQYACAK